jgi:PucR C-terminal helix-turn-helix domain
MADQAHGTALLSTRVRRRLPAIVDDLMERQWREVPEFFVTDDPTYVAAVRRSTSENAELMLAALDRPDAIPRALPPGPRLEAEVAAQHGAEVGALVRTYRLGQQAMVEHLIEDLDREGRDLLPPSVDVLREATRTLYAYMKTVIPLVAGEYDAERERLGARPDLGRLRRVQAFLAGDDTAELGYPVAGPDVAVVGALAPETALAVAAQLDAPALALRGPDGRCWAWLKTTRLDELRERLRRAGCDGPAGVGGPADFRAAHRQARVAERVARARGASLVDLRSAALEALALGDQHTAREVAHAELGPLAATDPRLVRLRATLEVWFQSRERLGETASALGVAPRTVTYRLRRAEGLLGHTIAERRAELEAALRLHRLFGPER